MQVSIRIISQTSGLFLKSESYSYFCVCTFLDECKTTKNLPCIFPMTYKGESVSMCIKSGSKYWCGTELKANGEYKKWGWCNDDCPNPDKVTATTTSAPGFFIY